MTAVRLDFLGIGAPKAGTTSLHEYLRTHPELFLPEVKEQPFFTRDSEYEEGWDSFARVAFHGAPAGRRYGKITPHYMGGPVEWTDSTAEAAAGEAASAVTARRIAEEFPDVKLIAMLRDPVERAISSYWQTTVLGDDARALDDALEGELEPEALEAARARPADGHQHVVAGEYGRILADYLRFFPRDRVFVGSMTVLEREPLELLGAVFRFLGVDDAHVPPNLGVRYQVRGTGRRIPLVAAVPRVVKGTPGLRHAWHALPEGTRTRARAGFRTVAHRLDQRKRVRDVRMDARPSAEVLERLRRHFAPDVGLLEELVGPVPGVTPAAAGSGAAP
jgi:hypothetical protein